MVAASGSAAKHCWPASEKRHPRKQEFLPVPQDNGPRATRANQILKRGPPIDSEAYSFALRQKPSRGLPDVPGELSRQDASEFFGVNDHRIASRFRGLRLASQSPDALRLGFVSACRASEQNENQETRLTPSHHGGSDLRSRCVWGRTLEGRCQMLCLHVLRKGAGRGRVCGEETEFVCWHCHTPRCANHGMFLDGRFLCLATAVREKLDQGRADDDRAR